MYTCICICMHAYIYLYFLCVCMCSVAGLRTAQVLSTRSVTIPKVVTENLTGTTSSQHERWTTIQAIDNSTVLLGLTPSTANHSNSLNLNIVVVLTCVAIVVCAVIVFIVAAKCLFRKYSTGSRLRK